MYRKGPAKFHLLRMEFNQDYRLLKSQPRQSIKAWKRLRGMLRNRITSWVQLAYLLLRGPMSSSSQQVLDVSKPQSTNLPKNFADEILTAGETQRAGTKLVSNARNFKAHNLMTVTILTRKIMESRYQLLQNSRQPPPSMTTKKFASQSLRFLPLRQLGTPRLFTRTIIFLIFGVFTCWNKLGNLQNEPE